MLGMALALVPAALVSAASPPEPTYGTANVDGNPGEWDLTNDFFADMYLAANPQSDVLSKLYLRYDCATSTLYVLVLAEPGFDIDGDTNLDNHFVKLGNNIKLVDGNAVDDGTPPDFHFIGLSGSTADGWEASAILAPGSYNNLNVHAQVDNEQTSAVADREIDLVLMCYDLGDLPTNYNNTVIAENGARHLIGNLFLGVLIDREVDGQEHGSALGDDINTSDDEDGVWPPAGFVWSVADGGKLNVFVTGGNGCLSGWMDWNKDGDFDEAGEVIINNVLVSPGQSQHSFPIPAGTLVSGNFFARFRLYAPDGNGTCAGVSPSVTGAAVNGEVEDYVFDPAVPTAVTVTDLRARAASDRLSLALGAAGISILLALALVFRRIR
jgi:hypothetical protein